MSTTDKRDESFAARIQAGISTVEAWDDDPALLAECRLMIPFAQLMAEDSPYIKDDDALYNGNALFLKRLAVHFQKDVMTWVNAPPCTNCGSIEQMKHQETRGPNSPEEHEGRAGRVEVYHCQNCPDTTTTFPRYNSCRKLLETKRGRCGEYANLFGLYCRAVGFETRYVSDWTDHVWTEVLVGDDWIMADSCEGTINEPSMYENGWGKKLNYAVGISNSGVMDVTPRYTRQFQSPEFQTRRRQVTSSEVTSDQIVRRFNDRARQNLNAKSVASLVQRDQWERAQLEAMKSIKEWNEAEKQGRGRISGSLEWRLERNEAGNLRGTNKQENSSVRGLYREQFYPTGTSTSIKVSSKGINVSRIACEIGQPDTVSVVVVDDVHLGCILQCRSFSVWRDVAGFLQTIPLGRIVALKGKTKEEAFEEGAAKQMEVLGGFQLPEKPSSGVVFLGRLGGQPEWTVCTTYDACEKGVAVEFPNTTRSETKLRSEPKTVPQRVVGRLPESVMPLQTQLMASDAQKRTAFDSYAKNHPNVTGYTTKNSSPIYLMDNSSFPFQETQGEWTTYHYLPEVLVTQNDNGANNNNAADLPQFDLPLDENFFQALLGPSLLVGGSTVPTADALRHSRLVGLYFSGHWCPPCKRFTPMLAELYAHLKEHRGAFHGLEMVFVSSDRSQAEFDQYYATMPWKAVPFDETRMRPQNISMRYGVRGIPALVILDAVSGQVVASIEQARNEVAQACSRGDAAIEDLFEQTWLGRVPDESRELFNLLELSSKEGEQENQAKEAAAERDAYLTISSNEVNNPWADQKNDKPALKNLDHGVAGNANDDDDKPNGKASPKQGDDAKIVLATMLKYLGNAVREPWNPKFRQFKMSNKIVDKATRLDGAIDLIGNFGMTVVPTVDDFMVSIPLASDLDAMQSAMTNALKEYE